MNNPNKTAEAVPSHRDRSLQEIANIIAHWVDYTTSEHGGKVTADTHVMLNGYAGAPPCWPSVGQLQRWIEVLRTPEPKGDAEAMCQMLERMWFDPAAGARVFINPDGPKAAAFIRSLQQRNAELGRALRMARIAAVSFRIRLSPHEIEEVDAALASVKGEVE